MNSVGPQRAGLGSAMSNTSREVGGVFGIALLGTILTTKLKASLAGAGASLDGVVKAQVYLSDREDVPGFNEVWLSYFKNPPATTIIATAQPGFGINNLRIEINTITLADNAKTRREAIRGPQAPAELQSRGLAAAVRSASCSGPLSFLLRTVDRNRSRPAKPAGLVPRSSPDGDHAASADPVRR